MSISVSRPNIIKGVVVGAILITIALVMSQHRASADTEQTAAQNRYLAAVKDRNDAFAAIQATSESSWIDLKALSGRMERAQAEEADTLSTGKWPATAAGPVAALIAADRRGLPYWHAASQATTEQDVVSNINSALVTCGGPEAREVRTALGLPIP